jgi:hypothetical protein
VQRRLKERNEFLFEEIEKKFGGSQFLPGIEFHYPHPNHGCICFFQRRFFRKENAACHPWGRLFLVR